MLSSVYEPQDFKERIAFGTGSIQSYLIRESLPLKIPSSSGML